MKDGSTYATTNSLPGTVKALPGKAQELWLETYNSAIKRYTRSQAEEIAWSAVRSRYTERSGTWSSRDTAMIIEDVSYEEVYDFSDEAGDKNFRLTRDGFLIARPRVARIGIQDYLGKELGIDQDVVHIYRPEQEVFSKDAMGSLAHRPITLDHPPEFVSSKNWKDYAIGSAGDEIVRDGEFVRIPMMIMDQKAIDAIKGGKAQLSVGYTSKLKFETGFTDSGLAYDAVQTDIRANHIAVVTAARGGPKLTLRDRAVSGEPSKGAEGRSETMAAVTKLIDIEGVKIELPENEAAVLNNHIARIQKDADTRHQEATTGFTKAIEAKDAEIAALKAAVAAKDTELATLQKKYDEKTITPKELDQMVADRALVVEQCKALVDSIQTDNVDAAVLKKQVVTAILGDEAKEWSANAIDVAFATLVRTASKTTSGNLNDVAASFHRPLQSKVDTTKLETEHAAYNKRISDAWKNPN